MKIKFIKKERVKKTKEWDYLWEVTSDVRNEKYEDCLKELKLCWKHQVND